MSLFSVLINLIILLSKSDAQLQSDFSLEDAADAFDHLRLERDVDYGTGLGGPVAANGTTGNGTGKNGLHIDECDSHEISTDHRQRRDPPLPRKAPGGINWDSFRKPRVHRAAFDPEHQANSFFNSSFGNFLQTFNKNYAGEESRLRLDILEDNLRRINFLNMQNVKLLGEDVAIYGRTPFVDLTHDEFLKTYAGTLPELDSPKITIDNDLRNVSKTRPRLDWRHSRGILGSTRSQGKCGSCYAFSIADLISSQIAIQKRQRAKTLSPQFIISCHGQGCGGARIGTVLKSISEDKGVPLEQCDWYQAKPGFCKKDISCCIWQNIKWFKTVDATGPDEKDIIAGLLQWGPVVAVIDASEAWQFYNGTGIIKSRQCSEQRQNHAVTLVGYNFQNPTPYYVVRNTWGTDWGDHGYAKLEAGTNGCSVARTVTAACAVNCDKIKDIHAILKMANAQKRKTIA